MTVPGTGGPAEDAQMRHEVADFDPSTGHLHTCRQPETCDCIGYLYCVAEDASNAAWGASVAAGSVPEDALSTVKRLLAETDEKGPDDFKTGQEHLSPAFREVNYRDAFIWLTGIVERIEAAVSDCTGAADCSAAKHIHGCFAEKR